jgi:hypothetical protein
LRVVISSALHGRGYYSESTMLLDSFDSGCVYILRVGR